MKEIVAQILKFSVVGGISFVVDFVVYAVLCNVLQVHYMIAGIAGFVVSVVVNYVLSMKFVFDSRDDMSKEKEFVMFVVLSLIGMGLNSFILYLCIDILYSYWMWLNGIMDIETMNLFAKLIATAIVMIYNFVTRKIFLEKRGTIEK